eukprot:TRINITY_DN81511_c0_g1_i1.p1 TRINITY_DN81511_c0_g1~~TRINITY_DN81511_c0_g1_i1.p1  ORF type:complete len:406 (+),score=32.86 TRINITY_DN81511_c0_g1_i1:139-1356(+)
MHQLRLAGLDQDELGSGISRYLSRCTSTSLPQPSDGVRASSGARRVRAGASESKWTPAALMEEVQRLPVHALFPQLVEDVGLVLERWWQRFPIHVWKRIVKVQEGASHSTPTVLKELNECAPVISRVRQWVDSLPAGGTPVYVMDLGAGFGFLSMLLSELLPAEKVSRCIMIDSDYPNRGLEGTSGVINTEHVYNCGSWRIPLHTLKVDLKKGRALNVMADRLLKASLSPDDSRRAPAIVCGVHLCNTLGLRAAQLFNEHLEVTGLALVPCCFPTQRHLTQQVVYQLGVHRFAADSVLDKKTLRTSTARFAAWTDSILQGLEPGEGGRKSAERHSLHRPSSSAQYAQDVYIFAERSFDPEAIAHADADASRVTGGPVIVDAEYGHATARKTKAAKDAAASAVALE